MAYTLTVRPEAELDIDEQYVTYESKRAGLGGITTPPRGGQRT